MVAHRSERKFPIEGAFTRGELTKQPGGLFFKRGRFARKSVPLLRSYLNLSADLIGTIIKIEVFLQAVPAFNTQVFILKTYLYFKLGLLLINE